MANKTFILAAYDNIHDAHKTIRELYSGGFQRDDIGFAANENDDLEAALKEDRSDSDDNFLEKVANAIGDFFSGEPSISDEEQNRFKEYIRRGGLVVSVLTPAEGVERAQQIMARHHPVDLTQRMEEWRAEGWTGYDPEAPLYTREEIAERRDDLVVPAPVAGAAYPVYVYGYHPVR